MKTSITATFTIKAAHNLLKHEGKCARLHGHEYQLDVTVSGPIQTNGPAEGMVMDFAEIKTIVNREVVDQWDHQYLNELVSFPTTAENLAAEIFRRISAHLPISRVRLWETRQCFAEVEI